jgi:hypothetical protein
MGDSVEVAEKASMTAERRCGELAGIAPATEASRGPRKGGQQRFGGEERSRGVRVRLLCRPEQRRGMDVLSSGEQESCAGGDERLLEVDERSHDGVDWFCEVRSVPKRGQKTGTVGHRKTARRRRNRCLSPRPNPEALSHGGRTRARPITFGGGGGVRSECRRSGPA